MFEFFIILNSKNEFLQNKTIFLFTSFSNYPGGESSQTSIGCSNDDERALQRDLKGNDIRSFVA